MGVSFFDAQCNPLQCVLAFSLANGYPAVIATMAAVVGRLPALCSKPCAVKVLRDDAFFTIHDIGLLAVELLLSLSPSSTLGDNGAFEESLLALPIITPDHDKIRIAALLCDLPFHSFRRALRPPDYPLSILCLAFSVGKLHPEDQLHICVCPL